MTGASISVEVIHATPELQKAVSLRLSAGATAREAALASRLDRYFPGLDLAGGSIGIWGRVVTDATPLHDGDRVELYRPLVMDPREQRRRRASAD